MNNFNASDMLTRKLNDVLRLCIQIQAHAQANVINNSIASAKTRTEQNG
jgi:hypothetical protein